MKPNLSISTTNKDAEQRIVLEKWADCGFKGTYLGATGLGKCKIGVMAAGNDIKEYLRKYKGIPSWLIVVPTENLRDNEWIKEFKKWGYEDELDYVTLECIQTAYKRSGEYFKGLIVDEVHTALSPEYKKLLQNNHFDKILCLTATIDDPEKKEFLEKYAPIFYETSLSKAKELEIVSNFKIFNLPIALTEAELKEYAEADDAFNKYFSTFDTAQGRSFALVKACMNKNKARHWAGCIKGNGETVRNHAFKVMGAIRKRKKICYDAINKIQAVKDINKIFKNKKTIVFSESIAFADEVKKALENNCVVYHSKITEKRKKEALEAFKDNCNVLSTVKALNVGFNVPACSLGIIASGSSKSLDLLQRLGRTLRWEDDKLAIFIQLYVKDSQEQKWVEKRCKNVAEVVWIKNIEELKSY